MEDEAAAKTGTATERRRQVGLCVGLWQELQGHKQSQHTASYERMRQEDDGWNERGGEEQWSRRGQH